MGVVIFFGREVDKVAFHPIPDMLYGKFSEGGFLFVSETQIELFFTLQGGEFGKHVYPKDGKCEVWNTDKFALDFLLLSVDAEESRKIYSTCEACAKVHKPYNLRDMLLIHIPFRQPDELSVIDAPTLNNAQAIILILRECLNSDNSLRHGLEGLNSRQTLLSTLNDRLSPHALPVVWDSLVNLLKS